MFKVFLVCSILTLTVCQSATLQETLQNTLQDVIVNGVNMGLNRLREEYQQKIRQLKTEAMSCVIDGSCSEILKKIKVSHSLFESKVILKLFKYCFS